MDIDTANNPVEADEAEAPELASDIVQDETLSDPLEDAENPDEGILDDDEEEIEYNGKRLKLPKELAAQVTDLEEARKNIQRDGTAKWQEAAELRKQAIAEREANVREMQVREELSDDYAALRWIEGHLQNLQQVDPRQLTAEQRMEYLIETQRLTADKQLREGRIQERKSELEAHQRQFTENTLRQAVSELQKPDPKLGWQGKFDKATSENLTKFALDAGFTMEEVKNTNHPVMIKVLNLAMQMQAQMQKAKTAVKKPVTVAKPVPEVSARKTSSVVSLKDMDKLSPEEWVKAREKQLARSRG